MDGARIQALAYRGMGKAASRIGQPFDVYRPSSATSVIAAGNKQTTIPAHFTADGGYNKPNTYGAATWFCMADGSQIAVGDYLVGPGGTDYFIAAKQPLLPILAVGCNRVLSITQGGTDPVAVGWPASVLSESTRGNMALTDIAGDPSAPHWTALMPAVAGITPGVADLVTDDLLRQYFITSAEITDLGWRIAMQESTQLSDSVVRHYATIIGLIGKTVTLRQTTTTDSSAVKMSAAAIGATSITLSGIPAPFTTVQAGDTFLNLATKLTVANATPVPVVDGVAAGVTFTPPLAVATTAGKQTQLTRVADYPVKCLIGDYEKSLINGSTIQVSDLRAIMATTTIAGAALPMPKTTDRLLFDAMSPSVIAVRPEYAGDQIAVFECQVRG